MLRVLEKELFNQSIFSSSTRNHTVGAGVESYFGHTEQKKVKKLIDDVKHLVLDIGLSVHVLNAILYWIQTLQHR